MPHRLIGALINLAIVLVSVGVTLVGLEVGARFLEAVDSIPPHSVVEARLRGAPADRGLGIDTGALIAESRTGWSGGRIAGFPLLVPGDLSGRYINIRDHRRVTTDGPPQPEARLWLFGGSTIFGLEVPDSETVASHLQRFLNAAPIRWRVENMGLLAMTTRNQLQLMRAAADIRPGDVVVFYDGVNDVAQWLFNAQPDENLADAGARALMRRPWHERILVRLHNQLIVHSAFVRLFLDPRRPIANIQPPSGDLVGRLEVDYERTLTTAAAEIRARGGRFVHLLQPNIFTLARPRPDEEALLANGWLVLPGLRAAFDAGYPALRRVSARLRAAGIASHDLSDALDGRSREIFYDFCHLNGLGNALIARAINARLQAELAARGP